MVRRLPPFDSVAIVDSFYSYPGVACIRDVWEQSSHISCLLFSYLGGGHMYRRDIFLPSSGPLW